MSNTDNFDSPDDMDQVLDKDIDFDDFEDNKDKSLGTSWKKSPLFKFGIVALVIIVVIGMISLFSGEKISAPTSVVGKGANGFKEAPGVKEVTPVMQEAIEEKNDQRIDEAQKQGMSAIPTPIAPPKAVLEVPQEDAQAEDPLLRWQQMQTERAKAQREQQLIQDQQATTDPQREAKVTAIANAMSQQMTSILGDKKSNELQHMLVLDPASLKNVAGADVVDGQVVSADGRIVDSSVQQAQKPDTVIVPAGKIEYAQMVLEANSDVPGPVIALMASGQFSGSKLIGRFSAQEEYLVITFTTLVTKKGTSIPINAYALDPATSLTGLATDVDHRYFSRIVLPAAASFVEGLGNAYAETTTETTQNSTTTTTSSTDLKPKQEFGKAIGEAAQTVGEILSEDGKSTKPLVIVAAGTPMGILFMESVTDKKVLQARSGGVSPVSAQPQGNQFNGIQNSQQNNLMNQLQLLQNGLQGQQNMQQNGYLLNGNSNQQSDNANSSADLTGQ